MKLPHHSLFFCVLPNNFWINRFLYGDHAIEGDLGARSLNHSKMVDVKTWDVDAKLASVNMGPWWTDYFQWNHFLKNQKYEREGRLKINISFCFLETSWTVALTVRQTKFGAVKGNAHTYKF
jgi:hypothetical protein